MGQFSKNKPAMSSAEITGSKSNVPKANTKVANGAVPKDIQAENKNGTPGDLPQARKQKISK